jgi:formate/nitrite transporter
MLAVAILALSAVRPAVPASVLTLRGGVSNAPKVQYHAMAAGGAAKTKEPVPANLLSGALSGAYVSFAAVLSITVASALGDVSPGVSKLVFGGLFPIALLHILAGGNQLFTGNTAACAMAYYEGLIDMDALIRNWVVTYAGNLAGSIAFLEAFKMTGLLTGSTAKMAAGITAGKIKATFMQQVVKGIFANWLVCLGVFMATGESDLVGKMVGAWFPVSAFVMIGFEHSIANLFLLPLGLAAGADATVMDTITKNIIPVTIGNIIAGAVVFGGSYSYLYGALGGHTKD